MAAGQPSPTRSARPTAATRCAARSRSRPKLFDGGVDWEGTFVDEHAPNILTDLPPAILNFPDYVASGFDPAAPRRRTSRPRAIRPTSSSRAASPRCGVTTRAVLGSDAVPVAEAPRSRLRHLRQRDRQRTTTSQPAVVLGRRRAARGLRDHRRYQRPLITVAGTMDALLPIDHHARAYARKVEAAAQVTTTTTGMATIAAATRDSISLRTGCTKCRTATTSRPTRTRSRSSS